ncbi:retron Ec67 family RNA-directed DNA polymerase/endonuclease [Aerococcus sp. UMB10185]|uniref:retron Ec67 family RNA-directed DNA polymerase/endonuclease n=2 Tax=Aerococcus TaxID=1375 RepID=UPI0008A9FFAD|nr:MULTISPECIES: retron Ec67 family RNA-directed DNA polymerase/endonuclease [unclassified Aerococcus]KAB0646301.1 RNA-directed DNA polymerase [Aerococcus sanguinicola]MDK6233134.1 retron Ec67 family RNA-directed DNA polymerase/endonuclease [Aerococcus sp. UMB10185]OHO44962.1 hypothetical protein HMPREF2705_06205 [Aerococcus sp. HMSC035B07]
MNLQINNFTTRTELANLLEIELQTLTRLLYSPDQNVNTQYHTFKLEKKGGGETRTIAAPNDSLKRVQRKLNDLLNQYYLEAFAFREPEKQISHGFVREKNIFTNASQHRNKKYILNIDLEDYFDHFHFGRVRGFFEKDKRFKLSKEMATVLAQLTCYKKVLPQGAPTSPTIANMITAILDRRILSLCQKYKLKYTRYADDLTFSTNDNTFSDKYGEFLIELDQIVKACGHDINHDKTHFLTYKNRQTITGLSVNEIVNVPRAYSSKTRAMAHSLYTKGEYFIGDNIYNINENERTLEILTGRFNFSNWIDNLKLENNQFTQNNKSLRSYSKRERDFSKFLFYKTFYVNAIPLLITEGKTDFSYINSAYKSLLPRGIEVVNNFDYKHFKKNNSITTYFLNSKSKDNKTGEGGDELSKLFFQYTSQITFGKGIVEDCEIDIGLSTVSPHFYHYFRQYGHPFNHHPVVILLDNENGKNKPLKKFLKAIYKGGNYHPPYELLQSNNFLHLVGNLYLTTIPSPQKNPNAFEIENLFTEEDKKRLSFSRNRKAAFSKAIEENRETINFDNFIELFEILDDIKQHYSNSEQY